MDTLLAIALGVGLSAAAGLRVFIPLLVLNLAARFEFVDLASGLEWVGSTGALLAFSVASAVEVLSYLVPIVDNILDTIATPAAAVAGTVMMGSVLVNVDPFWTWALAIIAGGGTAAVVQGTTVAVRATSTVTTAGLANPLVGASESAGSVGLSLLAVALPGVAALLVVGLIGFLFWKIPQLIGRLFKGRRATKVTPP